LAEFRRWFTEFDRARWDREIEQDMAADRLDAFLAEAQADYLAGDSARAL
jgi:predicted esterase